MGVEGGWGGMICVKFNVHNISNISITFIGQIMTTSRQNIPVCIHNMPICKQNMPSCKHNVSYISMYLQYVNMHAQDANMHAQYIIMQAQHAYGRSGSSNDLLYLRGSTTPRALPGVELTHQVNVVKSAIVELSVWHKRWLLQLIGFICGIQDV